MCITVKQTNKCICTHKKNDKLNEPKPVVTAPTFEQSTTAQPEVIATDQSDLIKPKGPCTWTCTCTCMNVKRSYSLTAVYSINLDLTPTTRS